MGKFNRPKSLGNNIGEDTGTPVSIKKRKFNGGRPKGSKDKKKKVRKPNGRPGLYNLKISNEICKFLAQGIALAEICRMIGMPSYVTVMSWLWDDSPYKAEFLNRYNIAREQQAEHMADELLMIADDSVNDYMERLTKNGKKILGIDSEHIQRSRLRVDTRKWVAARLLPKKYGDKIQQEVTGKDGVPLNPQAPGDVIFDFGGSKEGQEGN